MRRGRGSVALALVLAAALAGSGCALARSLYRAPRIADCSGAVVPSDALPEQLFVQLRARVRGDGVDAGLQLVASRAGGALALVGLNAFGAKLFALEQHGDAIRETLDVAQILSVPPANLLRDLHRGHFLALPGAPLPNGTWSDLVAGVRVEERWAAGQLAARVIREADGSVATVVFEAPRRYRIEHLECGYAATFEVVEER